MSPPSALVAVGDGANEVARLAGAGWGVVMGNGGDAARAVADAVVGANDGGGVAEAVERFVL